MIFTILVITLHSKNYFHFFEEVSEEVNNLPSFIISYHHISLSGPNREHLQCGGTVVGAGAVGTSGMAQPFIGLPDLM